MTEELQHADESVTVDSGLVCLLTLAHYHEIVVSAEQLTHEHGQDGQVFSVENILLAAQQLRLKAQRVDSTIERLALLPLPAIATTHEGKFFLIVQVDQDKGQVTVYDPNFDVLQMDTLDAVKARWSGEMILVRPESSIIGETRKFDFTWFVPVIVKYRKLLGEALLASFFLQIFALLTPLFFQVVMDKVLVHRGFSTLDVVCFGLLGLMLFESLLKALRTYVFSHTASRIDVELGARLFKHLVTLPLSYFQARRVGDSIARVQELEHIREFLTGNAMTLLLDVLFSVVFLGVMFIYSGWLTLVVVLSLPLYVLISLLFTPVLRARVNESFTRGAENQAFLVETINGIDTLKSMAVEPQVTRKWNNQLAAYVSASFKTQNLASIAHESVSVVGKLVMVSTLWLGARLVIEGELSVGQLIAFNMLAGKVAEPIMRLAQLWTQFQQTGVSVQRLGDILNSPSEEGQTNRISLPPVQGHIEFEQVSFRYRIDGAEVLSNLSLQVKAGEVIGIVGRSGSGKSTLTRLLQRMYVAERGRVLVDGMDLLMAEATSLRRQIGVVQQGNMLFARSIRENIALANPGASLEEVMQAAKMAGAHEFIVALPEGYNTVVGEHGASLSGGQRQRVAISRALMGDPRILIFDEATSALDYESERVIQDNMQTICEGRTVIIIAHRLSTVRNADRIVVMDRGQIVEQGTHTQLLAEKNGHYTRLYQLQQGV